MKTHFLVAAVLLAAGRASAAIDLSTIGAEVRETIEGAKPAAAPGDPSWWLGDEGRRVALVASGVVAHIDFEDLKSAMKAKGYRLVVSDDPRLMKLVIRVDYKLANPYSEGPGKCASGPFGRLRLSQATARLVAGPDAVFSGIASGKRSLKKLVKGGLANLPAYEDIKVSEEQRQAYKTAQPEWGQFNYWVGAECTMPDIPYDWSGGEFMR